MLRFLVLPASQRLIRTLAAAVAASMPVHVLAQTDAPPAPTSASDTAASTDAAGVARQRQQLDDRGAPTEISAERLTGRPDRELRLERNVEVKRGNSVLSADRARYDIIKEQIEATGNIRLRRFGDRYTGDALQYNLESGEGFVENPTYELEQSNARGRADRIEFESEDVAEVVDGTYSTCEGPTPDWYLKAGRLRLDQERDTGVAYGSVVYFKGVPILGAPALSFPLSSARKTGVLPPTIGTTNKGGLEVTVPYYFNIAPNRDLTLYPKIIAERGVQLGATGRYLGQSYSGQTSAEVLPDDNNTGTDRWAYSSVHAQTLAPGLLFGWNLNGASDDDYPSDFSSSLTTSTQRILPRDVNLSYTGSSGSTYWGATARAIRYQVLQDPVAPIGKPYDRLPQLTLNAGRQNFRGFDWGVESEYTHFSHPDLVNGERLYVTPRIAYPILRPGYFITPKLSLDATTYRLENPAPGTPRTIDRTVPTFSVDSGMVFERDTRFFGQKVTQTLEPRLFYVNTPYRDQSQIPLFDTALADFNFTQLFSENRFVGHDRIADANQLTTAVVSRYIEPTGIERMRLAVGQRFNFRDPQVTLGQFSDESRSDLLLSASGRLTSTVSVDANIQYSQSLGQMNRDNYAIRWQPGPARVLNLQYRRDQANPVLQYQLEQIDISGQWPIGRRWYGVGRINFSLEDNFAVGDGRFVERRNRVAESLIGVEYKADCWVFRFVAQRTPTATERATSSIYVQLELNGLSKLGSDPLRALRSNVPGYQTINQSNRLSR